VPGRVFLNHLRQGGAMALWAAIPKSSHNTGVEVTFYSPLQPRRAAGVRRTGDPQVFPRCVAEESKAPI
jgi:hypothetical protein